MKTEKEELRQLWLSLGPPATQTWKPSEQIGNWKTLLFLTHLCISPFHFRSWEILGSFSQNLLYYGTRATKCKEHELRDSEIQVWVLPLLLGQFGQVHIKCIMWIKWNNYYLCEPEHGVLPCCRCSINITTSVFADFLCRKLVCLTRRRGRFSQA